MLGSCDAAITFTRLRPPPILPTCTPLIQYQHSTKNGDIVFDLIIIAKPLRADLLPHHISTFCQNTNDRHRSSNAAESWRHAYPLMENQFRHYCTASITISRSYASVVGTELLRRRSWPCFVVASSWPHSSVAPARAQTFSCLIGMKVPAAQSSVQQRG